MINKQPGHQGALLWLARIAMSDKKSEPNAEGYLLRALNNNPEDFSMHFELAKYYERVGNLRQSMLEYEKSISFEYELVDIYRNYEKILMRHKLDGCACRNL